jgi:hypothetical protein
MSVFFILSSVLICLDTISIILLSDVREKIKKAKIQNVGKHFDELLEKEAFYLASTIICSSLTFFFIVFDLFIR